MKSCVRLNLSSHVNIASVHTHIFVIFAVIFACIHLMCVYQPVANVRTEAIDSLL